MNSSAHMEQLAVQGSPIEAPDRSLGIPDSLHVDEAVVRDDDDVNDPAEPGEHRPQLPGLDTASDVGHIHGIKLHGWHSDQWEDSVLVISQSKDSVLVSANQRVDSLTYFSNFY